MTPKLDQAEIDDLISGLGELDFAAVAKPPVVEDYGQGVTLNSSNASLREAAAVGMLALKLMRRPDRDVDYECGNCDVAMDKITVFYGKGRHAFAIYCPQCNTVITIPKKDP